MAHARRSELITGCWKVRQYLREGTEISNAFVIATGYFGIGFLLPLDAQWLKLDKIPILMGDEVFSRTRDALLNGVGPVLDASIEQEAYTASFIYTPIEGTSVRTTAVLPKHELSSEHSG